MEQIVVEAPVWVQLPLVLVVLLPVVAAVAWGLNALVDAVAKGTQ